MNQFGKNIRISLFGESHGESIGLVIDGFPSGVTIDNDKIRAALINRQGISEISTTRREPDNYDFVSGVWNNITTGSPICIVIPNVAHDDKQYFEKGLVRPGHADLTYYQKYNYANDYRGGGHASGRLTAPFVILGVLCEDLLNKRGIITISKIHTIGNTTDTIIDSNNPNMEILLKLRNDNFPIIDSRARQIMKKSIIKAKNNEDSLGGIIQTFVVGLKAGVGEPFFDSVESILSHLMFAIPGAKGIEFGQGFATSMQTGSQVNDQLEYRQDRLTFLSNNAGGINGGVANGNTIDFKVAFRPTSSIAKPQKSINIISGENVTISSIGHHDPCFVPRAVPVVQSLTSFAILDLLLESEKNNGR